MRLPRKLFLDEDSIKYLILVFYRHITPLTVLTEYKPVRLYTSNFKLEVQKMALGLPKSAKGLVMFFAVFVLGLALVKFTKRYIPQLDSIV